MGSQRLPGKVLLPLGGKPMLHVLLDRVQAARQVDEIVVATSTHARDDVIERAASERSTDEAAIFVCRGSEDDVLGRFYGAACERGAERILRVTADNPLFDVETADALIELVGGSCDYAANNLRRTYPYGLDLEAFTFTALEQAHHEAEESFDREHVTPFIRRHPQRFPQRGIELEHDHSQVRLTVDTEEDYRNMKAIFDEYGQDVSYDDLL